MHSVRTARLRHGYGTAMARLHVNTGGARVALARGVVRLVEDGEDLVRVRVRVRARTWLGLGVRVRARTWLGLGLGRGPG